MTFLVCLLLPLVLGATAWAADVSYTSATGNYDTGANWNDAAVPDIDDNAYVNNNTTVTLNAAEPNVAILWVGGTTAAAETTGGSLLIQNGAALNVMGSYRVGSPNPGVVLQTGGTIRANYFTMGNFDQTNVITNYYGLSGGLLIADCAAYAGAAGSTVNFGRNDTTKFEQTGGSFYISTPNYVNVGYNAGAVGEVIMTNGTLAIVDDTVLTGNANTIFVGRNGGRGTLTMSGGSVHSPYKLFVGANAGSVGTFNQNGGAVTTGSDYLHRVSSTTSPEFCVGFSGGTGTYNLTAGTLNILYKARISGNDGTGVFNVSGGTLLMPNNDPNANAQPLSVGYTGGKGEMNFSGTAVADIFALYVGDPGGGSPTGGTTVGTVNITGGSLATRGSVIVGATASSNGFSRGTLNVSNGTLAVGSKLRVGDSGNPNVPSGLMNVNGTASGTVTVATDLEVAYGQSKGTLNISENGKVTVSGKSYIGRIDSSAITGGTALLKMTGGSFIAPSGTASPVYIAFRGTANPGVNGTLDISSGVFQAGDLRMLNECSTGNPANKAYLKIDSNAKVTVDSHFGIYSDGENSAGTATVQMEVASATKNSLLNVNGGAVELGSARANLIVNRASTSYRPSQGNQFTLISATGGTITGSFSGITSNIPGWLRTNIGTAINLSDPATYRPVFSGAIVSGTNYVVTFQGAKAGDATGDNKVDGTDLAAVGASWLKTGGTYNWLQGDFNGDGIVDGTDLAALGASWLWAGAWPGPAPADAPLPEPATLVLLSLGGLALIRRRKS
jgi:hypothetical protein